MPEEFDATFAAAKTSEALIILPSGTFAAHRRQLVDLAMRNGIPSVWEHRQFTDVGGLLSYGPDFREDYCIAARYVDRILKGAKAAEMPVEQVAKLDLVVNLKAARALGLRIPAPLLVRGVRSFNSSDASPKRRAD